MRKISYVIAFLALAVAIVLNIFSTFRNDWVTVKSTSDILHTSVTDFYGLRQTCRLTLTEIPEPGGNGHGKVTYRNYECRPFPASVTDECEDKNRGFCASWTGAAYVEYVSIGFAAVALVAILFGMTTHSRRVRIWKALAGLALAQTLSQVVAFALVTDTYHRNKYPGFDHGRLGIAWAFSLLSWITSALVAFGVVVTGIAADKGYNWAVGNRDRGLYERIRD
ncbi:hypothetical protein FA15DRAFT_672995 [Coprinopsis marcescibilis]|uniref:Uncharacterized protein n=1 Tax=Coprinopsis marcescibilis TaxID=230819 RepID=A0A5C3KLT1_COPMA|nr:hypothetical protein FA15DRAFT_672995 [Coprinopsis marcescibilis]